MKVVKVASKRSRQRERAARGGGGERETEPFNLAQKKSLVS